jgi:ribosome modulation factor
LISIVVASLSPQAASAQVTATRTIETPFIWTQTEAEEKCPAAASAAHGQWTGQWRIGVPGKTTLCEITDAPASRTRDVEAGPIWNQADAEQKCQGVAARAHGRWTGQWRTTDVGRMSVCQIADEPRGRDVEAGPIWDQADAQAKCPIAAYAVRGRWTGQWRTTVQGQMSVCEIVDGR